MVLLPHTFTVLLKQEQSKFPETLVEQQEQDLRWRKSSTVTAFIRLPGYTPSKRSSNFRVSPLSYNNLLDTDAAWAAVRKFDDPSVIILSIRILVDLHRQNVVKATIRHLLAINLCVWWNYRS